jgi:hypothetical protein
METENKTNILKVENGNVVGSIWFIGWLFTLGFAKITWWQSVIAVLLWPYYLGLAAR